jgi:hypothetical protein
MNTRNFPCKIEHIPTIGELIVDNAEKDIDDFNAYSSVFTADYFATIRAKIEICKELTNPSKIYRKQETIARQLYNETKGLRLNLNALERYLKRVDPYRLDFELKDAGLKNIRLDIARSNIERLLVNMNPLLTMAKRNLPVLDGLKRTLIDEMEVQLQTIETLNIAQNTLAFKRNKLKPENAGRINDLWNSIKLIMAAARAIYRGCDEEKLKGYTIAQLKKLIS